jgi:polyisoprenoid-binding protein YceI
MKTKTKTLLNVFAGLGITAALLVTGCKKENKVEMLGGGGTAASTDVIDATNGAKTNTISGVWKLDKTHSNVMWETKYYTNGAALTGRFNNFDIRTYFDGANPGNIFCKAWVQLSTYNTGESGRDAYGKCGPGYMGVQWDTVTKSPVTLKPRATTDTAWFNSTKCERLGNGYLLKGDFKFRGVTIPVEIPLTYTGISVTTNATTGKKTSRAGLYGQFVINANTVFKVNSTSIDDLVTIRVNANMVTNAY